MGIWTLDFSMSVLSFQCTRGPNHAQSFSLAKLGQKYEIQSNLIYPNALTVRIIQAEEVSIDFCVAISSTGHYLNILFEKQIHAIFKNDNNYKLIIIKSQSDRKNDLLNFKQWIWICMYTKLHPKDNVSVLKYIWGEYFLDWILLY